MIDKKTWLSHFRDEEQKIKAIKIYDKISICYNSHKTVFTDFINPYILGKIIELSRYVDDIDFYYFGGYGNSERKKIGICRDYTNIDYKDFPLSILKIDSKSSSLSHRDYLGSLIGLGIDRSKIGDIIVSENYATIIVSNELENYIYNNLTKIGRQSVSNISILSTDEIVLPEIKYKEIKSTVSSLRVDSVLGVCFSLSRSNVVKLIRSEKALKNGMVVSPSSSVNEGDILSLRGYGRAKLHKIGGTSKKDRTFIIVHKYI